LETNIAEIFLLVGYNYYLCCQIVQLARGSSLLVVRLRVNILSRSVNHYFGRLCVARLFFLMRPSVLLSNGYLLQQNVSDVDGGIKEGSHSRAFAHISHEKAGQNLKKVHAALSALSHTSDCWLSHNRES